ncbi:MAG: hypothetical protein IJA61_00960 [Clostridia bacterium]|nr:hypothetical protein [Clostridia bacterium]
MEIIKVILLALVIVFTIVFIKQLKPEFALLVSIAGSLILLGYVFGYISNIITLVNNLISKTGVGQKFFTILMKAIGVGYLVEFASSICRDNGNTSIADKVALIGKIYILSLSIPIISEIYEIISGLL